MIQSTGTQTLAARIVQLQPLIYRDPQYLFGKILTHIINKGSAKETSSILKKGFAQSKCPYFHSAYVIGGIYFLASCMILALS